MVLPKPCRRAIAAPIPPAPITTTTSLVMSLLPQASPQSAASSSCEWQFRARPVHGLDAKRCMDLLSELMNATHRSGGSHRIRGGRRGAELHAGGGEDGHVPVRPEPDGAQA